MLKWLDYYNVQILKIFSLKSKEFLTRKFLSHSACLPISAKATNFDSMIKYVIHVCFLDLHKATSPPRVNTQPIVDLLSPIFDI